MPEVAPGAAPKGIYDAALPCGLTPEGMYEMMIKSAGNKLEFKEARDRVEAFNIWPPVCIRDPQSGKEGVDDVAVMASLQNAVILPVCWCGKLGPKGCSLCQGPSSIPNGWTLSIWRRGDAES